MEDYKKRGYLLENFRLFHLRTEKDSPVDYHYHEFCKILFLVSGHGGYFIEGQRYHLQPGDVIMIGSRTVHRPEIECSGPYERIIIYISPDFLQQHSAPDCSLLSVFSGEKGHVLRLDKHTRKTLFDAALALERELDSNGFGKSILGATGLLRLLIQIGRGFDQHSTLLPGPIMPKNERIMEMLRYIDQHISEDLDIDLLAEQFFISKYHMMRLFHQETGSTIHTYMTIKRLLMAKGLIENGIRATDACYRCGFRSYSSFTRAYTKHFGTTPTGRMDKRYAREESYE